MFECQVIHLIAGQRKVYKLLLPDYHDPGFYRQAVSYDAFFQRMAMRCYEGKTKDGIFILRRPGEEIPGDEELVKDPPIVGIWAFYKFINYDYKKQKFNEKPSDLTQCAS